MARADPGCRVRPVRRRAAHVAGGRGDAQARRPFATVWLLTSIGLIAIYTLQEAVEGIVAEGHPGGIEGIFGHGGAWAIPVAVVAAFLIAVFLTISHAVISTMLPVCGGASAARCAGRPYASAGSGLSGPPAFVGGCARSGAARASRRRRRVAPAGAANVSPATIRKGFVVTLVDDDRVVPPFVDSRSVPRALRHRSRYR